MERAKLLSIIALCLMLTFSAFTITHHINESLAAITGVARRSQDAEDRVANAAVAQINAIGPQATRAVGKVSTVADRAAGLLQASQNAVTVTSAHLNAPCEPAPCGTLADINRTLATARGTLGQGEMAARAFNRHSSAFYDQETQTASDVQTAADDLHRFMTAPDIYAALHNFNTASAAVTGTAQNVDAITLDGRTWVHAKLYPTKRKGFVSGFEATGDVIHHWFPPLF